MQEETRSYQDHEIAGIFPLIGTDELYQLAEDIEKNGLVEPIWIHEGKILDGRNRYRACGIAEVEPTFRTFKGDDPVGFVVSLNLRRRHLDESQRSMVAANIANMENGTNRFSSANWRSYEPQVSQAKAAEMLNVSERSITRAKKVQRKAVPEIVEKVESGDLKVSTAAAVADLPKTEQSELAALAVSAIQEAVSKKRNAAERQKKKQERQDAINAEIAQEIEDAKRRRIENPPEEKDPAVHAANLIIMTANARMAGLIEFPGIKDFRTIRDDLNQLDYTKVEVWCLKTLKPSQEIIELCDLFTDIGAKYREFEKAEK